MPEDVEVADKLGAADAADALGMSDASVHAGWTVQRSVPVLVTGLAATSALAAAVMRRQHRSSITQTADTQVLQTLQEEE